MRDETKQQEPAPEALVELLVRLFAATATWPVSVLIALGSANNFDAGQVLRAIDCLVRRGFVERFNPLSYTRRSDDKLSMPIGMMVTDLECQVKKLRQQCDLALLRAETAETKLKGIKRSVEEALGLSFHCTKRDGDKVES